jgi:arylsulfatase
LVVHWPKGIPARGELRHDVGHVIDLVPTLMEIAGVKYVKLPAGAPALPGRSLVPAFARDGALKQDFVFWHHQGNRALRVGDWKIVSARDDGDKWGLYNVTKDRAESEDLAAAQPGRVEEMAARWQELENKCRHDAGPAATSGSRNKKTRKL